MSGKDIHKDNKPPNYKCGESNKESANCHIVIDSGVKLDFVDSFKEQHKTERSEDQATSKKQLRWTKATAILVAIYTLVMIWQACLTRQSLKSTENFATLDQRPYLYMSPEGNIPAFTIGTPPTPNLEFGFTAMIHIKNFGKSPARHVFSAGEIFIGGNLKQRANDWFAQAGIPLSKTLDNRTGFYTLPNGYGIMEMSAVMQETSFDISVLQMKGLKLTEPPRPPAVCVGRIEYSDSVGNLYWTDHCMMLGSDPSGKIVPSACTTHNEVH
jgi:hypothetical protein